jgi:Fe-S-cluster-containing dehydrogenase component/CRP-like cAMP-binding protein
MPTEQTSRRAVLNAIKQIPSIASLLDQREGHYEYELDLEVVVYGRNYNGKKVGPYVRLLDYQPGEIIVTAGEWGGNAFHIVVQGSADVVQGTECVAQLSSGATFGQMSLLAGVPRNATVKASPRGTTQIMEVQRPALRLLRKLPKFGEELDEAYRKHGRDATIEELKSEFGLSAEVANELKKAARFRTFAKNHVLFRAGAPISRIFLIKHGWLRRTLEQPATEDLLGGGYCFGLEALQDNVTWPYTMTLLGRTEVFEISVVKLRQQSEAMRVLTAALGRLAPPALTAAGTASGSTSKPKRSLPVQQRLHTAQADLIETGLVDATNLLVMDMDMCVRCGNCSLACHRTHGQSRLVRRGVHIERLKKPKLSAAQSLLSPEVCMHCKDPECLTGCPTGAIERLQGGQIDIKQAACIGCGDCATQCPYDAISMIPRPKPVKLSAAAKAALNLRDLFRLSPDPLPPAVETLDDLVAVKCNLCNDRTSLNPPGKGDSSHSHKYSCEENCPTGALARVNPRQYFDEISQLEGPLSRTAKLQMTGPHQAIGRNIHLADWPKRGLHLAGLMLTVLSTAAAAYGLQQYQFAQPLLSELHWQWLNMRWLTGLAGLFGIVGVMLYPWRRVIYTRRAGPLRYWLLTHTYLGVIATIMLLLHGGSQPGGWLTTALMLAFDGVILTGLFGIACYQVVPRLLTQIEGAPLLLDDLLTRRAQLQVELDELTQNAAPALAKLLRGKMHARFFSFSFLLRQYWRRESLEAALEAAKLEFAAPARKTGARILQETLPDEALTKIVRQALREPQKEAEVLAALRRPEEQRQCQQAIEAVRRGLRQLDQAVSATVTLRRVDALIYLHRLLKLWLPPHVATTAVMLALLLVHIIQVIYFAAR